MIDDVPCGEPDSVVTFEAHHLVQEPAARLDSRTKRSRRSDDRNEPKATATSFIANM